MHSIISHLALLSHMIGVPVSAASLQAQSLRHENNQLNWRSVQEVLQTLGLDSQLSQRSLQSIPSEALPVLLTLRDEQACVLTQIKREAENFVYTLSYADGRQEHLGADNMQSRYGGVCWFMKRALPGERRSELPEYKMQRLWLWKILWRYKGFYLQAIVATFVVNCMALVGSLYVMQVYDRVIPNKALETLAALTIGAAMAILFESIGRIVRSELTDAAGKKIDLVVSAALFRRVMQLDLSAKPVSAGSHANNLRDFEAVREFLSSSMLLAIVDLPFVLLYVFVIFLFAGPLGWVPLISMFIILILGLLVQWPLAKATTDSMKAASARQGLAVEAIEGLETLKTHNGAAWAQQQWEQANAQNAFSSVSTKRWSSVLISSTQMIGQLTTVGVVFWGVYLIHHDTASSRITMGALIAAVMLTGKAIGPISQVTGLLIRLHQTNVALKGIDGIINRPSEAVESRTFVQLEQPRGTMQLKNASYRYSSETPIVIENANLRINAGDKIAILGKVGSGKSTLLRILAGLYQTTSGEVLLDGLNVRQIQPTELRQHIGLLGQQPRLFMGTLRSNMAMAQMDREPDAQAMMQALERFGLSSLVSAHPLGLDMPVGEDGAGLSGGQRQLIGLARFTLRDPQIVLLDEPTSGLDQATEIMALKGLMTWAEHRSLIVVTHRPQILENVTRIIAVDKGRIVLDAPKAQALEALSRGVKI